MPLGNHLQDSPWDALTEGPTCPLCPCQMWTNAWRGLTTATSMPSARTPHGRTSASASLATQGMVNTAKVRLGGHPGGEVSATALGHTAHDCKACSPCGLQEGGWEGWLLLPQRGHRRLAEALVGRVHSLPAWLGGESESGTEA